MTVYILLGVLYESTIHPITILSTLPSAGVGALLSLILCRNDFSVVALIGIILLIGIVEKNAIMMIDFALDAERKDKKAPLDAITQAALQRFRPIIMTTMAALLAGIPLALGSGTGSELQKTARDRDRGRAHLQPAPDALHDAGHLPRLRPPRGPAREEARPERARERRGRARAGAGGGPMSLSAPFIRRPIGTSLLTVALALAGGIAYFFLPVAPLPQVEFPTISVSANLPGASPETMASSVATPLERQFGRIAGITEMTSQSSLGSTSITLQFDLTRNIDAAGRDVQAAINAARGQLPSNLPNNPRYRKVNPADAPIMLIGLTSDTRREVADVRPRVLRPPAEARAGAGRRPGVRGRRRASRPCAWT